jgi:hypothetical protein
MDFAAVIKLIFNMKRYSIKIKEIEKLKIFIKLK